MGIEFELNKLMVDSESKSLVELHKKTKISYQALRQYSCGHRCPSLNRIKEMCQKLKVDYRKYIKV